MGSSPIASTEVPGQTGSRCSAVDLRKGGCHGLVTLRREAALSVSQMVSAQAERALTELRARGWTVGPSLNRDRWRLAVRRRARSTGLRIRTGEAQCRVSVPGAKGEVRSWAMTVDSHQGMRDAMGGMELAERGSVLVDTAAQMDGG